MRRFLAALLEARVAEEGEQLSAHQTFEADAFARVRSAGFDERGQLYLVGLDAPRDEDPAVSLVRIEGGAVERTPIADWDELQGYDADVTPGGDIALVAAERDGTIDLRRIRFSRP